ncbi:MAG TPA: hypothetical protein VGH02_03000 [Rhizomicrobium sp.]|jgi:hypothetical protein
MKRSILLAGIAATALSLSPVAFAQSNPAVTNPTSPTTANPKSDLNTQCTQPAPGEAHVNMANCPKTTTAPTPTKTLPQPKSDKKTATPANATQTSPPVLPATNPASACPKPTAPSTTAATPSTPGCDSNSGVHEGGPFGH